MTIDCLFKNLSALAGIEDEEEEEWDGANGERAARLAIASGREEIRGLRIGAIAIQSRESTSSLLPSVLLVRFSLARW